MINPDNHLLQYFPFLLTLAPLILFFQQTKHFVIKILRIFWKERFIPYDFTYEFYSDLSKKSLVFNFDDYNIKSSNYYSLEHKKWLNILFKFYKFEFFLYKNCIPIFIFGDASGGIKIQYLKYSFNFEKFLIKIVKEVFNKESERQEEYKKDRFYIETKRGLSLKTKLLNSDSGPSTNKSDVGSNESKDNKGYEILDLYRIVSNKLPRSIAIDIKNVACGAPSSNDNKYIFTEQGKKVLSKVQKWLNAENFYQEKGIRWYRGMALIGEPGTGKSTLVFEIAKKVRIPIFIFDLSSYCNSEFDNAIESLPNESGIVLFEDLDVNFDGRNNLNKTEQYGGLTFDCLINKLSGIKGIKNKFVFVTTNHINKLDEALKREGRIDEIIEINSLNKEEKLQMAKIILDNNIKLIEKVMENSDSLNTAQFENLCVSMALNNFWSN